MSKYLITSIILDTETKQIYKVSETQTDTPFIVHKIHLNALPTEDLEETDDLLASFF